MIALKDNVFRNTYKTIHTSSKKETQLLESSLLDKAIVDAIIRQLSSKVNNMQTEDSKTYHTDFIRYHLHCSDSKCPDRLRRLVNEGKFIQYLDDMELKVGEAISPQVELWKQTDSCYQKAVLSGDDEKMLGLENCFVYMAREAVFESMIYIFSN